MPEVATISVPAGVVIAGTLDVKAGEIGFVKAELERRGINVILIDCGVLGDAGLEAQITRQQIAEAGGGDIAELRRQRNRETALPIMQRGLEATLRALVGQGRVQGYLGIGGGTNTMLAAAAFRVIPYGVPKLLVSTRAAGDLSAIVGVSDCVVMNSVVDVLGLNAFLRGLLRSAAAMLAGAVGAMTSNASDVASGDIGMTTFGCTTEGALHALALLEARGLEVLAFHARGTGGRAAEAFMRAGRIRAMYDLSTTEIADEIVGGVRSAGPERLEAAGAMGRPQVVLPGAIDVVNLGERATIPTRFAGRRLVAHTPISTLMRTTPEENIAIARFIAEKLNLAKGPAAVVIPTQGFSSYDAPGQPFLDPGANQAFTDALQAALRPEIPVTLVDAHLNDKRCAECAVDQLLNMIA